MQSNQSKRGRGGSNTGAQRNTSGPRPTPYSRNSASSVSTGTWQHDKFAQDSNLYSTNSLNYDQPQTKSLLQRTSGAAPKTLHLQNVNQIITRPKSTPPSVQNASNTQQSNTAQSVSLLERFGVKGASAAAEARKQTQLAQEKEKKRKESQEIAAQQAKETEAARQKQQEIAEQEERGFVVEVGGLVPGTSAEDVQTAFNAYGETIFCYIVGASEANLSENPVARLTFKTHHDATNACATLNGVVADGRPLRVNKVERTPFPPLAAKSLSTASSSSGFASSTPTGPRAMRNNNSAAALSAVKPGVPPVAPVSRMQADLIDKASSSMDVDEQPSHSKPAAKSAAARPTNFNNKPQQAKTFAARLSGQPQPNQSSQSATTNRTPNLLQRMGGAAGASANPSQAKIPNRIAQKPAAGSSLLARMK